MAVAKNQRWDYRWEGLPRKCELLPATATRVLRIVS